MRNLQQAGGQQAKSRRTRRAVTAAVVLVLFLALAVVGIQLISGPGVSADGAPEPSASSAPPRTSTPTPAPGPTTPAPPVTELPPAAPPVALSIPAAGFDVPVLPLQPNEAELAAQSIVPPETLDGYWLANLGQPGEGSDNTVYITGHSWEGRESPFNKLSSEVEPGDTVTVTTSEGTIDYVVDSITTHNKDTLKNSDIWNIVPNRLVLISCYTEDLWGKNVIVTAMPVQ